MNINQQDRTLLVSVNAAARLLSLGRSSIYNLMASTDIETVKIGNRRLIKLESIEALIDRNSGKSS
jgi:excisionase family DNA binding protein